MPQRVGVVLAGGAGRRMGQAKGELEIDGRRLAERAASVVWPFCSSVLVSVAPGADNPAPECAAVKDALPAGRGPLSGIDAAFRASGQADLLVLACDYPQVSERLLRRLLSFATSEDDLVLVSDARGRDHPLVALWSRRMERPVSEALATGLYKVRALLAECRVRRLGTDAFPGVDLERELINVNWPADLEKLDRND